VYERVVRSLYRIGGLVLLLTLCGPLRAKAGDPLTGFWQAPDGGAIEFFENRTYSLRRAPAGPGKFKFVEVTSGKYQIPEPGRLRLAMGGQTATGQYRLEGDRLTIVFPAEVQRYARATPPE
jgi:hypothetical protein